MNEDMQKEKLNNHSPVGETENWILDTSSPIREHVPENKGYFLPMGNV